MRRKYYEAYDDRYSQVHKHHLQWFSDVPTGILTDVMARYDITHQHRIIELGCGEGRDAYYLLSNGFAEITATDISPEAIRYCKEKCSAFEDHFQTLDFISDSLNEQFDFIYAVAVLHMLLEDEDRDAFYQFIHSHLAANGVALICTMGDGEYQFHSDKKTAFALQERVHQQSGKTLHIAGTSCRVVDFGVFRNEIQRNDLCILEQGVTAVEPDFPEMMYAVVRCK